MNGRRAWTHKCREGMEPMNGRRARMHKCREGKEPRSGRHAMLPMYMHVWPFCIRTKFDE